MPLAGLCLPPPAAAACSRSQAASLQPHDCVAPGVAVEAPGSGWRNEVKNEAVSHAVAQRHVVCFRSRQDAAIERRCACARIAVASQETALLRLCARSECFRTCTHTRLKFHVEATFSGCTGAAGGLQPISITSQSNWP